MVLILQHGWFVLTAVTKWALLKFAQHVKKLAVSSTVFKDHSYLLTAVKNLSLPDERLVK